MFKHLAAVLRLAQQPDSPTQQENLRVFYTWGVGVLEKKYDPGFRQEVKWDVPLLEGYDYEFAVNTAKDPGSHHFFGIKTPGLIRQIAQFKPDAVLVYGWAYQSHLQVMWHFKGKIPVWFRGDSTLLDETEGFSLKKVLKSWWLKFVYRFVDTAFYVGEANRAYFLKYGLNKGQLAFAPHAVDNDWFEQQVGVQQMRSKRWRVELGIKDEEIVFLFVGKLEPKKNPTLLLLAFLGLNESKAHLVFAGAGELEGELKQLVKKEGIGYKIHFLGFQNQRAMPAVYGLGNILVLPSNGPGETWGLAVNEAMCCGLPVIVSDKVGCARNLIDEGETGYIFSLDNPEKLGEAMIKFLGLDYEYRETMSKLTQTKVSHYTIPLAVERLVNSLK